MPIPLSVERSGDPSKSPARWFVLDAPQPPPFTRCQPAAVRRALCEGRASAPRRVRCWRRSGAGGADLSFPAELRCRFVRRVHAAAVRLKRPLSAQRREWRPALANGGQQARGHIRREALRMTVLAHSSAAQRGLIHNLTSSLAAGNLSRNDSLQIVWSESDWCGLSRLRSREGPDCCSAVWEVFLSFSK